MFDRVWIRCPECNLEFEQQTKAGPCQLNDYHLSGYDENVPASILEDLRERDGNDIDGYNLKCTHCGCQVEVVLHGRVVGIPVKRLMDEDGLPDGVGDNINRPRAKVYHATLKRVGDSMYKSVCPFCADGVLLMHRDKETMALSPIDRCIKCAQEVEYLDLDKVESDGN
jgi:hypothetical protein